MHIDYGVEETQAKARTRYNFNMIRAGASLHVKDNAERCRVLAAFKYWTQQDKAKRGNAYATSAKVGDEDPRGPGFRIWFKSKRLDAQALAAKADQEGDI